MDNGKLFSEVGDIIDSGEVPQDVSNRLLFALVMRINETVREVQKTAADANEALYGEAGTVEPGIVAKVEINDAHIATNKEQIRRTSLLLTGVGVAIIIDIITNVVF